MFVCVMTPACVFLLSFLLTFLSLVLFGWTFLIESESDFTFSCFKNYLVSTVSQGGLDRLCLSLSIEFMFLCFMILYIYIISTINSTYYSEEIIHFIFTMINFILLILYRRLVSKSIAGACI